MLTLDVEAVRAFVVITELKSFTRAAETLGTSQSALSVKLKRLESKLEQRLIERTPRQVRLSWYGELFIDSARDFIDAHERAVSNLSALRNQLKLGVSCHAMGPEISQLLTQLKLFDPSLIIEVQQDNPRVLLDALDADSLDIIIIRSEDDRRYGTILCPENFGWYATPDFDYKRGNTLPLASLNPLCGVRDFSTKALTQASIVWSEVFVAGGTQALEAATLGGLAVGVFPHRSAPKGLIEISELFGLPSLPATAIVAHTSLSDKRTRSIVNTIEKVFMQYTNNALNHSPR